MITLSYPDVGTDRYFLWRNWLIGPFKADLQRGDQTISFPSEKEYFDQRKGIWGDNPVSHGKCEGSFTSIPALPDIIPAPTTTDPDRCSLRVWTSPSRTATQLITARFGLALPGVTRKISSTAIYGIYIPSSTGLWTTYEATAYAGAPTRIQTVAKYEVTRIEYTSPTTFNYWYSFTTYRPPSGKDLGYINPATISLDDMLLCMTKATYISGPATQGPASAYHYQHAPTTNAPPLSALCAGIQVFAKDLYHAEFPIEKVAFGELAATASQSVNANDVNMLAFLNDLRHPRQLLLRLRNLRRLKQLANNYLSVEYGILPTISDIEEIVKAMRRMRPFLDRNGFSIYTAKHDDSMEIPNERYILEQHMKLAIANEDQALDKFINRLDSMGTLPTLKNVWDLIPYSFVVDWLVDVGDWLEAIDSRLRLSRLDVKYATWSQKLISQKDITPSLGLPFYGTISWTFYRRWVADHSPTPPLLLKTAFTDFDHWLESTALIIQRRKR